MTPVNRWIVGDRWFASVQKIILEMCTTSPRHFRLVVPNYSLKNWLIRHLAQNEYPLPDITTPDELIFSASGIPASGPNPVRLHHLRTQFIRSFEHQYPDLATRLSIAGIWNQ
ncbi:hypothetical protein EBR96_03955, partial [bacterium]|nr:hypothetical protein [bacterium]